MLVKSFIKEDNKWVPVAVELTLWPGLPTIQFLGLPDQQIKESAARIKSALKAQGFEFPKARQILVNIGSSNQKKSSQGLELAVAVAYLLETGQVPGLQKNWDPQTVIYGNLSLAGEVGIPADFDQACFEYEQHKILTGQGDVSSRCSRAAISCLFELQKGAVFQELTLPSAVRRPPLNEEYLWSEDEALLMSVVAAGEHSLLMAGAGGCGKTTLAKQVHGLLQDPPARLSAEINKNTSGRGFAVWRPLIHPHHSVSSRAMIGGGSQIAPGEITRAHGGILLMDEFLEFDSYIIESLREPLEEGVIRLARGNSSVELPAKFQLIATTNLCPCGSWSPDQKAFKNCRFSAKRCRSYAQRFSGPILDRFQMVAFAKKGRDQKFSQKIGAREILDRVQKAHEMRKQRGQEDSNARCELKQWRVKWQQLPSLNLLPTHLNSLRRTMATLRVARTLADLEQCPQVLPAHLTIAMEWSITNFESLTRWD